MTRPYLSNETFFASDLEGLYKQHETMWTVYIESLKILVTLTSLPLVAASFFIGKETGLDWGNIALSLRLMLCITPVLDVFMVGVVINHRLVVILYARAINGYRGLFLAGSSDGHERFRRHVNLPTRGDIPPFYEPSGPMGVIVAGIALVNATYLLVGLWDPHHPYFLIVPLLYIALLEFQYYWNCRRYGRSGPGKVNPT